MFAPKTRKLEALNIWEAYIEIEFSRGKKTMYERARSRRDAINLLRVSTAKLFRPETAYTLVPNQPKETRKKPAEFELIAEMHEYDPFATWEFNLTKALRWQKSETELAKVCTLVKEWLPKISEQEGLKIILEDK